MQNLEQHLDYQKILESFKLYFEKNFENYINLETDEIQKLKNSILLSFGDYTSKLISECKKIIFNFLNQNNIIDNEIITATGLIAPLSTLLEASVIQEKQKIQQKLIDEIKNYNNKNNLS
ncbi:hypothetical protein [Chryseobacterium luquanense]|uniref:Uncharacterized protein n=1 Tax=Chryseobacterium luquanense TaxID=2983766 RepID=A0ABT3Y0E8_9FLAO|nr:hypothetical protein [Chryseobacterium luquanense]MCX8531571.1 hypothetical protein [Chryseobacterium luquanense]